MTNNTAAETIYKSVAIEEEMQKSYLDYSMSVIVSRALPDCRDGLKPVQRRILYAMHLKNNYTRFVKSAAIVGEVISKFHPHGDLPIYGALVRMAQEFLMRMGLVIGQGNFGSMDGDPPAAMRYTEVKLAKLAGYLMEDINYEAVNFKANYDGTLKEPEVLPARFPNILINGSNGIAVGMATSIPTHNFNEVMNACCAYIRDKSISDDELFSHIKGPDFPTGGIIIGRNSIRKAMVTGRGSIVIRGRTHFEEIGGKSAIIITEIPYMVNKADMVKKIEDLSELKTIEDISEIRDESNKNGVRVVVELKRNANQDVILNQLFKHTSLQSTVNYNVLALKGGQPQVMGLRNIISAFVEFREVVVRRRTAFLLQRARDRAHLVIGLIIAVNNIDEVIKLIKASETPQEAREKLLNTPWQAGDISYYLDLIKDYRNELGDNDTCYLTEEQVRAILEMKLQKLTGLEKQKLSEELKSLSTKIEDYLDILTSEQRLTSIITDELTEVANLFECKRLTTIEDIASDVSIEDLIQREDMVVIKTMRGYIKRVPLSSFKAQKRGGKGKSAINNHDDDFSTHVIATNTHQQLLMFSNTGKVYKTTVYKLPVGSLQSKGRVVSNLFSLEPHEKIIFVLPLPEQDLDKHGIIFATKNGMIRRNSFEDFATVHQNGKIAIKLEDDELIGVSICKEDDHIFLASTCGKAIRFPVEILRVFKSRNTSGIRGMKLKTKNDSIVSLAILKGAKEDIETREKYLKIPVKQRLQIISSLNAAQTFEEEQEKQAELAKATAIAEKNSELLNADKILQLAEGEDFILTLTAQGMGKYTSAYEYRVSGRGGQGVQNIILNKDHKVIVSTPIGYDDHIMLITNNGTLIRTTVKNVRISGRSTKGVKIINVKSGEEVISATRIAEEEQDISVANNNEAAESEQ